MNKTSLVTTLWRMRLRSMRNAVRHDQRTWVALVFGFVIDVAIILWSLNQLLSRLHQWQVQAPGAVTMGLWSLCLLTWEAKSSITIL